MKMKSRTLTTSVTVNPVNRAMAIICTLLDALYTDTARNLIRQLVTRYSVEL